MAAPLYSPASGYGTKASNYYFIQTPTGGAWSNTPASTLRRPTGSVLGSTNTLSGSPQSVPTQNLYSAPVNTESDAERAAREAAESQLRSLNTEYDRLSETANLDLTKLATDKTNALANIDLQRTGLLSSVGAQKTSALEDRDANIQSAGNIARTTQSKNRNALRAMGILNSSAAGDILSRPMEEFDQQRATFVKAAQDRVYQLDDFLNQKTSELALAVKDIESQYADLVSRVQSDLRFSDRERADAIEAANAALSQRLSEIKLAQQSYSQQVEAQKVNLALQLGQMQGYKFPTVDASKILSTFMQGGTTYTPQTVGIYTDEQKRLSGLL
jgi:hypothetical protein